MDEFNSISHLYTTLFFYQKTAYSPNHNSRIANKLSNNETRTEPC